MAEISPELLARAVQMVNRDLQRTAVIANTFAGRATAQATSAPTTTMFTKPAATSQVAPKAPSLKS